MGEFLLLFSWSGVDGALDTSQKRNLTTSFFPTTLLLRRRRPETCPAIKRFAQAKGVEFTMMDKVDVNGIDAHPVYHYLKKVAGPVSIQYYVFTRQYGSIFATRIAFLTMQ